MSQLKFVPKPGLEERVVASPPHAPDTYYRVAIGTEDWDGLTVDVEKVQMVYGGKVAGRKAPSYPTDSDDADRVRKAAERLRHRARDVGLQAPRAATLADLIGSAKGIYGTPNDIQDARDELRGEWP